MLWLDVVFSLQEGELCKMTGEKIKFVFTLFQHDITEMEVASCLAGLNIPVANFAQRLHRRIKNLCVKGLLI